MKLSTVLIAGAALASAAAMTASAASAATVFEAYGYDHGGFDGVSAFVTSTTALDDVTIGGEDFGALAAGGTAGFHYVGDNESGPNPSFVVTITKGGHTSSGTFSDVIGDADWNVPPVNVGSVGVPEPTTWALMLMGFGGLGAMLRSRKSVTVTA